MNPIFVTGAQGFAGRAFVAHALNCGERVVGFGRSQRDDGHYTHRLSVGNDSVPAPVTPENQSSLASPMYTYHSGDLLDDQRLADILRKTEPRAIVHLASGLRGDDFASLMRTNVMGTMSLFDAIARAGVPVECVVLGSSGGVYGKPKTLPIAEDSPCEPIDLYATSKLVAERIGVIRANDCRVIHARFFNLIGAGQDERHVCGRFAAQAIAVQRDFPHIIQVGDLRPTRDFVDVRDAASAIMRLLPSGEGPYNICSGAETSIATILDITLECVRLKDVTVEQTYTRDADICRHFGSNRKLRDVGWVPAFELRQSVEDLVNYYRSLTTSRV